MLVRCTPKPTLCILRRVVEGYKVLSQTQQRQQNRMPKTGQIHLQLYCKQAAHSVHGLQQWMSHNHPNISFCVTKSKLKHPQATTRKAQCTSWVQSQQFGDFILHIWRNVNHWEGNKTSSGIKSFWLFLSANLQGRKDATRTNNFKTLRGLKEINTRSFNLHKYVCSAGWCHLFLAILLHLIYFQQLLLLSFWLRILLQNHSRDHCLDCFCISLSLKSTIRHKNTLIELCQIVIEQLSKEETCPDSKSSKNLWRDL